MQVAVWQVTVLPCRSVRVLPAALLVLQVLKQALRRESGLSPASQPHASRQAPTWHVASLTAASKTRGARTEPVLSSVQRELVLSLRSVSKARASQFPTLLLLLDRRLPRSRDIFLSFFPSTDCHICQSNDDRLRLTPILRLINTLLLSGSVTDGTSALVLFHVLFMLATLYLSPVHSLPVSAHIGRTDSALHLWELRMGVPSFQQPWGFHGMSEAIPHPAALKGTVQPTMNQFSQLKTALVLVGPLLCLHGDLTCMLAGGYEALIFY